MTKTNTQTFPFTDRATWLAWRADWRARYAEASETIRASKRTLVETHAEQRAETDDKLRERIGWRASSLQSDLAGERRAAHELMLERTAADEQKAEQIAERRKALAA